MAMTIRERNDEYRLGVVLPVVEKVGQAQHDRMVVMERADELVEQIEATWGGAIADGVCVADATSVFLLRGAVARYRKAVGR